MSARVAGFDRHRRRELVHLRAVHVHVRRRRGLRAVPGGGNLEQLCSRPVRAQLEPEDPGRRAVAPEHDRPRAVTEEDARRAVAPVEEPREDLGADHEHGLGQAGCELAVGLRERVDEPGARRRQVVPGHAPGPDALADQRRGRREVVVGAGRGGRRSGRDPTRRSRRSRARARPHSAPRPADDSPSPAIRRWRMPVRLAIHSSDVSTIVAISSFVITRSGRFEPTPTTSTPRWQVAITRAPPRPART